MRFEKNAKLKYLRSQNLRHSELPGLRMIEKSQTSESLFLEANTSDPISQDQAGAAIDLLRATLKLRGVLQTIRLW